jgi:glutathione reductase (NADPH)
MAPIRKECDYLVIGGGSGGLASARRASSMYGAKVIAIESKRLGGTCVNVGCVPKKVTWNAASIRETLHDAKSYGFNFKEVAPFDWTIFKQKRDAYVKKLNGIYARNLDNDKVEYIHGHAIIKSKDEVEVTLDDGSKQSIGFKKLLVAVGGHPTNPPKSIPGAELGTDSDGFFEIEKQPKKVAIIGAGYIAVEFAGMFHALGTETHLFIRYDTFLRTFDPMIQEKVVAEYERQGIHIHKCSSQSKIEDLGDGWKRVHYKDKNGEGTLDVDALIWAIGRTPQTEGMGLEKLGIKLDEKGHIIVDDYQSTNVENVYALGDVCNKGFQLTPVAIAAGRRLSDRLFGGKKDSHLEYSNIPSVVFAHPEVGAIGMTEPQARMKYGDSVKVYQTGFTAMYYAMMDNQEEKGPTAYKVVCEGPNERVVGIHILGQGSSEVLQGFGVAVKMGATKADLDRCVAIHPTSAEELVTLK